MSIEKQLENEENILEAELNNGMISMKEYSEQMRELERDAREYYREELDNYYNDWCRR